MLSSLSPAPMSPVKAGDKSFFSPRDTLKMVSGNNEKEAPQAAAVAGAAPRLSPDQTDYGSPTAAILTGAAQNQAIDLEEKKRASTMLMGK
jgi:hypothetical protein